jgi:hypothetical protein
METQARALATRFYFKQAAQKKARQAGSAE